MSFLLNVITGYLNEDTEIRQSQAEYDRKVQEARRKALEEEKKDARKFKQELYKSNYNFYGEVNKKFMSAVADGKIPYNASFSQIIAHNQANPDNPVPIDSFFKPVKDADYQSKYGDIKFKNKNNGNSEDAMGFLSEVSTFGSSSNFKNRMALLRENKPDSYNALLNDIQSNIFKVNLKVFETDKSGTQAFDPHSIFGGLKNIEKFNLGPSSTDKQVTQSQKMKSINQAKEQTNAPFYIVGKANQSGMVNVTPLNFEKTAEINSAKQIGKLIGSPNDIMSADYFVNDYLEFQPDLSMDEKVGIFKASAVINTRIDGVQGLDPDRAMASVVGGKADKIFMDISTATGGNVKYGVIALSPFMQGPYKDSSSKVAGIKVTKPLVSKEQYLVHRIFKVPTDFKQTDKISFKAIQAHTQNNIDVVQSFNTLENLVKQQGEGNVQAYTLFKENIKAIIDLDVGIAGAVLRDLGLGRVDNDSSASIGIKDRLTSGYVDKMQQRLEDAGDDTTKEGITARKIEAIKISLAFKMARAADPSGRLSNQDVEAQYVRLGRPTFTKDATLELIELTRGEFQKQADKFKLLIQYGTGADPATDRDFKFIDAAIAYDHLRKESFAYQQFKNRADTKKSTPVIEIGKTYTGMKTKNPIQSLVKDDGGLVYRAVDKDGKFIGRTYLDENNIILDPKTLKVK